MFWCSFVIMFLIPYFNRNLFCLGLFFMSILNAFNFFVVLAPCCLGQARRHLGFFGRILNDDLAKTVKKHPKRFVGLGTLPMQVPNDI